jgi:hypothetical protein
MHMSGYRRCDVGRDVPLSDHVSERGDASRIAHTVVSADPPTDHTQHKTHMDKTTTQQQAIQHQQPITSVVSFHQQFSSHPVVYCAVSCLSQCTQYTLP